MPTLGAVNQPLADRSRLSRESSLNGGAMLSDLVILFGCGVIAAATSALVDLNLRLPGHAILKVVLPLSLGMALVPRRGSGVTMGAAAGASVLGMSLLGGSGIGPGALTSLLLLGPLLDVAVRRARPGWRLYVAFATAGLVANLGAFMVRGGTKMSGGGWSGLRPLQSWLSVAPWSYAACGLIAGLISAVIWFRASDPPPRQISSGQES